MFRSLRSRLLSVALGFLTLAWLATLTAGFFLTRSTLNSPLDRELQRIAQALLEQPRIVHRQTLVVGRQKDFEFQIFEDDKLVAYSDNAPKESLFNGEGFSQGSADQKQWRVFSTSAQNARIAVGQDLKIRQHLIHAMIASSLWPMAVALPLIALILWLSVNFALKPLKVLANEIQSRTPKSLVPIHLLNIPSEVAPVVASINDLLGALQAAFEREKHFTDDAAHELRTPLAGIKAQTEALLGSTEDQQIASGLRAIKLGVDRASRTVGQLLTLARLDPKNPILKFKKTRLAAVVEQVIAQMAPLAISNNIDLGLTEASPLEILGDEDALATLVTNLLDNALKFAPPKSRVDVSVSALPGFLRLSVEDAGIGIPPSERARVFERFVRVEPSGLREGSGIGLSIVKRIADLHNAKIELSYVTETTGLRVRIDFPSEASPCV